MKSTKQIKKAKSGVRRPNLSRLITIYSKLRAISTQSKIERF